MDKVFTREDLLPRFKDITIKEINVCCFKRRREIFIADRIVFMDSDEKKCLVLKDRSGVLL